MAENIDLTGLGELNQIESELSANMFADTSRDCATGTCS